MAHTDPHQSVGTNRSRSRLRSRPCLLAGTLLMGLASVSFWVRWRGQSQQKAIQYINQLGGEFHTQPAEPVWLHDLVAKTLGAELAVLFTDVTYINLGESQITDDGLQLLSGLNNLEGLDLTNTQVSDAGLQNLSGLTNLRGLWLDNTQVTDGGLQHLSGLTDLERLQLRNTQVSDVGLQHVNALTNLKGLFLEGTLVTDTGESELQSQLPGVQIVR